MKRKIDSNESLFAICQTDETVKSSEKQEYEVCKAAEKIQVEKDWKDKNRNAFSSQNYLSLKQDKNWTS